LLSKFSLQATPMATALCYPFRMERPRYPQPASIQSN